VCQGGRRYRASIEAAQIRAPCRKRGRTVTSSAREMKRSPYVLHRLPSSGCGDLPDRSSASTCFCTRLGTPMRVCREHCTVHTYARHTVEMRLDRDGDSLVLLYILLPLLHFTLPQHWVGSRSYCVQEETLTLFAAVDDFRQKVRTLSPRLPTHMYPIG